MSVHNNFSGSPLLSVPIGAVICYAFFVNPTLPPSSAVLPWRIDNRRPQYNACASRKVNTFLSDVELCFMNFPSVARSSAKSL